MSSWSCGIVVASTSMPATRVIGRIRPAGRPARAAPDAISGSASKGGQNQRTVGPSSSPHLRRDLAFVVSAHTVRSNAGVWFCDC